jgi:hypothetical protein
MGDVIHVAFGSEREWEDTLRKIEEGLVTIGSLFGDSETLMRAKAHSVYRILRGIVEQVPAFTIGARVPEPLTKEQREVLTGALKQAALKATENAMTHCVQVLMSSIYDLCTSKLHTYSTSNNTAPNNYLLIATALGRASAKAATYPRDSPIKPSGVHFTATVLADELAAHAPHFDRTLFLKTFYAELSTNPDFTGAEICTSRDAAPSPADASTS